MDKIIELNKTQVSNQDVIVWFSNDEQINKNTYISVPMNYKAVAIEDERVSFRVEPCVKENLCKMYDKSLNGKMLKFVYAISTPIPPIPWGFGNIQVNNERLKEAYRVGANGKYIIEIADYGKFLKAFSTFQNVTVDDIREKTISIVKTVGIPVLSKCFSKTDVSVFEIDSKLQEIRADIKDALLNEVMLKNLGIKLVDLTVDGIHVNESDLEIIRNRING